MPRELQAGDPDQGVPRINMSDLKAGITKFLGKWTFSLSTTKHVDLSFARKGIALSRIKRITLAPQAYNVPLATLCFGVCSWQAKEKEAVPLPQL